MTAPSEYEAEQYDALLVRGSRLLTEAMQMRGFEFPDSQAGPHDVHDALVTARGQLDRLEAILLAAMSLRDNAVLHARRLEQAADDAWDDEADRGRRAGQSHDFEGAQERYATWRLKTREQRAAARAAREAADDAVAVEKRVQVMYRGLDGVRLDLHRRLGAFPVERSIER